MENKKIFMIVLPFQGHMNPLLSVAQELVKRKAHVIFYSYYHFKDKIEKSGVEFREYPIPREVQKKPDMGPSQNSLFGLVYFLIKINHNTIPFFAEEVKKEKPDLIIYDLLCLIGKYLLNHLRNNHGKIEGVPPAPPAIFFSSSFGMKRGVIEGEDLDDMVEIFKNDYLSLKEDQNELNKAFGLTIEDPVRAIMEMNEKMVLVSIFPEFQPKRELFDDSFHFIGSCVSSVRNQPITDPKLKSIIDLFNPVNPLQSLYDVDKRNSDGLKLVYVSLGTVFNKSLSLFNILIDSFRKLNDEVDSFESNVSLDKLRIIFSLGNNLYDVFQNKISNEGYVLPNNILLLPSVPQIDILQRASLFITHCGMNSAHETIKFGVPIVAIPLDADQPKIASRVCDDLQLGVKLDKDSLTAEIARKAVSEVFKNDLFKRNMIAYSKISANYDGVKIGSDLIEKFIKENPVQY